MRKIILILCLIPFIIFSQPSGQNNNWVFPNNVTVDGYLRTDSISYSVIPARCSAYVDTAKATDILLADTYYFLKGKFANKYVASFTNIGDTLVYDNGNNRFLYITYSFTCYSSASTATVAMCIYKNDVLIKSSVSSQIFKNAGDDYNLNNAFIIDVNNGDKIKIMIKSDKSSSTVTAREGTATAIQIP